MNSTKLQIIVTLAEEVHVQIVHSILSFQDMHAHRDPMRIQRTGGILRPVKSITHRIIYIYIYMYTDT